MDRTHKDNKRESCLLLPRPILLHVYIQEEIGKHFVCLLVLIRVPCFIIAENEKVHNHKFTSRI